MRLDLGAPFVQRDCPSNAFAHDADPDSRPDTSTGAQLLGHCGILPVRIVANPGRENRNSTELAYTSIFIYYIDYDIYIYKINIIIITIIIVMIIIRIRIRTGIIIRKRIVMIRIINIRRLIIITLTITIIITIIIIFKIII